MNSSIPIQKTLKKMAFPSKIRRVGSSLGVIIPSTIIYSLGLHEGDVLSLQENNDGTLKLTKLGLDDPIVDPVQN